MVRQEEREEKKAESRILLDHGTQIIPQPSLFFIFVYIYAQFRLGQVCPAGEGKRFSQGPEGLEPPAGTRIEKKE